MTLYLGATSVAPRYNKLRPDASIPFRLTFGPQFRSSTGAFDAADRHRLPFAMPSHTPRSREAG